MKKIAIVQSNYIPWKGYFDLIAAVDEFIIYDELQFTRRDWRNRNQIKTPQGLKWLSVPVKVKGKYHQAIREVKIDGFAWAETHWKTLFNFYRRAPYFDEMAEIFEPLYRARSYTHLSVLNRTFIDAICALLGINTKITDTLDYHLIDGKTERLTYLCHQAGATEYISGPTAKGYLDENIFKKYGIKLTYFDYRGYPEYPQLWGEFTHYVSILDLLFNCGYQAPQHMKNISL